MAPAAMSWSWLPAFIARAATHCIVATSQHDHQGRNNAVRSLRKVLYFATFTKGREVLQQIPNGQSQGRRCRGGVHQLHKTGNGASRRQPAPWRHQRQLREGRYGLMLRWW